MEAAHASSQVAAGPLAPMARQIGPYRLERVLAAGAMGRVCLARHERLGRRAAVKILHPQLAVDEQAVSRFFCEARAVADTRHPHLVDVYDFLYEPERGLVAYVMEYLDGEDLARTLARSGPLAPGRVARIGAQVCDALAAVHALGVVHRDLKPDNIVLVRRGGDPDFVKVLDFGIAQFRGPVGHHTAAGTTFGSPAYMSPEQARRGRVDSRSDLYALGCVLHELLTGQPPFLATTARATLELHATAKVPRIAGDFGAGEIPAALAEVVRRCLAKRPDDRPQTADALHESLLLAGQLGKDDAFTPQHTTVIPKARRSSRLASFGAVFAAGVAVGAVVMALI